MKVCKSIKGDVRETPEVHAQMHGERKDNGRG